MRRDFDQRLEHKSPLMQTRMRQHQELSPALDVAVHQEIQIDRAWAILQVANAAEQIFDSQQAGHYLFRRRQRVSNLYNHIQVGWLLDFADWLSLINRRDATDAHRR